jgi:hypothetical protein
MLGYFCFHNQDSTMQTMERVKIQKEESTKICVGYLIYRIVLFFFVSDPDAFVLSHIHLVSVFYLTIFRFDEIANFACRRYKTMDPKSRKIQSNLVLLQPLLRPTIWSQMIAFEPFNIAYDVLLCSFQAFLCRERDFESGATLCVTSESLLAEMKKRLSFDRQRRHLKFADRRHLKFAVGIMVLTSADLLVRLPIPIPFRFFLILAAYFLAIITYIIDAKASFTNVQPLWQSWFLLSSLVSRMEYIGGHLATGMLTFGGIYIFWKCFLNLDLLKKNLNKLGSDKKFIKQALLSPFASLTYSSSLFEHQQNKDHVQ